MGRHPFPLLSSEFCYRLFRLSKEISNEVKSPRYQQIRGATICHIAKFMWHEFRAFLGLTNSSIDSLFVLLTPEACSGDKTMRTHETETPELIWGAEGIARFLGLRNAKAAYLKLEAGRVPGATKVGALWALSPKAFRERLEKQLA
jgi:hypothetical protein